MSETKPFTFVVDWWLFAFALLPALFRKKQQFSVSKLLLQTLKQRQKMFKTQVWYKVVLLQCFQHLMASL